MGATTTTYVLGYGGAALFILGFIAAIYVTITNPGSYLRKQYSLYEKAVDAEVRFQLIKTSGPKIAMYQVIAVIVCLGLLIGLGEPIYLLAGVLIAFVPLAWLRSKHAERVRLLEDSLDSWLLMLANALKASPSLGEAIQSSAKLMRAPMSEELDLVIKEMKLGTPLDQAVLNMSTRIKSRVISSSLATILVGRQTGGDLPKILEESAATLREMSRLEGVVRTKTAEGKMQAFVLAAIPFVLLVAIHNVDPMWLRPLVETNTGYLVVTVATALWASAIVMARRILTVDV